ncbi:MAG: O-antigen ligase family protein [Aeromicrobium sp.]
MIVIVVCLDLEKAGILFVTAAMFAAPLNDLRISASSYVTASDLLFVLGLGLLAPVIVRNRFRVPALFVLGMLILLTMGAVASLASDTPLVSANQVGRLVVGAFALPIIFLLWRPAPSIVTRLAGAYIFGTVFSVGTGLLQGPVAGDPRYVGFTYHPNFLGLECLLAAALVPYVTAMIDPARRWVFWGAGVICAFGVYISGSRAALLVLIMLILIYPFVERSVKAGGVVFAGMVGVLAFAGELLNSDGDNALARLFGGGSASGSDIQRDQLATDALKDLRAHPLLGNGFDGGLGAHDIYLQVAVAVGIFGLIGYLMILWTGLCPVFWQGVEHRLAYPVLAYAAIGPLTNILWDRLIWAVIALAFTVVAVGPKQTKPSIVEKPHEALSETRKQR